jgi:hypothetical protein
MGVKQLYRVCDQSFEDPYIPTNFHTKKLLKEMSIHNSKGHAALALRGPSITEQPATAIT